MLLALQLLNLLDTSGGAASLVDTGLVVRYYFDEAASGSTPTHAVDSSGVGSAFNLTLDYGSGNLTYTEVSGNRGLDSALTDGTQGARGAVSDTSDKVRDALHGVTQATLEVVYDADTFGLNGSRILSLNGATADFSVHGHPTLPDNHLRLFVNGVEAIRTLTGQAGARKVLHLVLDTPQATASDRLRLYMDGTLITSFTTTVYPAQDATLSLSAGMQIVAAGQGTGTRNIDGRVFYGALYSHAFSAGDVTNNYGVLTLDDDAPAGGDDTTPDAFSFSDQSGVATSSVITSAPITITGINAAADVTVTNGEHSIDGGAWTSSAGTVTNGQEIRVRHTSSGSYETAVNTILDVGGVTDTFTSTTEAEPVGGGEGGALIFMRRRLRT